MKVRLVRFASGIQRICCTSEVARIVFGPFKHPTRVAAIRAFGELGIYRLVSVLLGDVEVLGEIIASCTRSADGSLIEPVTAQWCVEVGLPLAAFDGPRDVDLSTCSAGTTLTIGLQNWGTWAAPVEVYLVAYEAVADFDPQRSAG